MRIALTEARRASGRSHPNPPVGAVVFRGDRILGRGHTQPAGGPHAEIVALERAARADRVRGASLAVTLEPCSFQGRTGPCAAAAIRAGLRRVFVGHVDPHPRVRGRGVRQLRRSGIDVTLGVLEAACREQHRGFVHVIETGRPFVSLKLASTLDGRIATERGESRWITGDASRALAHRLRARVDAILVGAGTALADDPDLSARRGDRLVHAPVRVLADTRLRVPPSARLFRGEPGATWVLCAAGAPAAERRAREERGARLFDVPLRGGRIDLRRALEELAQAGLTELLVEGGGDLAASLLREGLVDELHWFTAPRLIGAEGRPAVGPLALRSLADAVELEDLRVRRLGGDLYLRGRPRRAPARGKRR